MRTDLRKRKPGPKKRRLVRQADSDEEDEREALIGTAEDKPPATVQGKGEER